MSSAPQALHIPGYEVLAYLGSGARSTIWRVRQRRTNQEFALKRVVRRHLEDRRFLEQTLNEGVVGARLDHPVVRHVHRTRRVNRWFALREVRLIMELCHGNTVQETRPESIREVLRIFTAVADGLVYVNAQGFVHADMKPNNILVGPDGTVKVIDLGQSCPIGTVKKRIQGTPDFIAPEQVRRRPLDARTDVFNFGAALYWTLTGKPIPTLLPKKDAVTLTDELSIVPADELNPRVPAALSKLIRRCVEQTPARRPSSMEDVKARLGAIAASLSVHDAEGAEPRS